jgi:hypothetical protein
MSIYNKQAGKVVDCLSEILSSIVEDRTIVFYGHAQITAEAEYVLKKSGAASVCALPLSWGKLSSTTEYYLKLEQSLLAPSDDILRNLDRFDPHKNALVYAGSFISAESVGGRKIVGQRTKEWQKAERKESQIGLTSVTEDYCAQYINLNHIEEESVFYNICIEHAPCVVAGDRKKQAITMGGDYVFVVDENYDKSDFLNYCKKVISDCDGVRIGSLCRGIPTTVYGFVDKNEIIYFKPVEAIVGHLNGRMFAPGVLMPGCSSPVVETVVIETIERFVATTNYRGAFGIDGIVMPNRSFIVHEINPRICAGFSLFSRIFDNMPFNLIDLCIREKSAGSSIAMLHEIRSLSEMLEDQNDIKLWNDAPIEQELANSIPVGYDETSSIKWKAQARKRVLNGYVDLLLV